MLAVLAVGTIGTTAVAQQPQQSQPITVTGTQAAKKVPDPNEIVCEKQQDTSSRLISHKVCMTRSQWSEQRRLDRQEIDKAQTLRPM
jgi:hypothetical protein